MNDEIFLNKLNEITKEYRLKLPVLGNKDPGSRELSAWARFLELCIKKGISLGDKRWGRLVIKSESPHTKFALEGAYEGMPDTDFRVGLQLLLGMLHENNDVDKTDLMEMP